MEYKISKAMVRPRLLDAMGVKAHEVEKAKSDIYLKSSSNRVNEWVLLLFGCVGWGSYGINEGLIQKNRRVVFKC
ncbi:hypothetical protein PILCRDRAFT_828111, partial [Piloderma croceum F 1598]